MQLRFVCMSDTHSLTSHISTPIPDGDVFVHAGDFTRAGGLAEVREFNAWIAKVRHSTSVYNGMDSIRNSRKLSLNARHYCLVATQEESVTRLVSNTFHLNPMNYFLASSQTQNSDRWQPWTQFWPSDGQWQLSSESGQVWTYWWSQSSVWQCWHPTTAPRYQLIIWGRKQDQTILKWDQEGTE